MKSTIRNRNDIIKLVNTFYDKVKKDAKIGYFFTEVAHVNWEDHLSKMYDFWDNILFCNGNYTGNPIVKHKELHQKSKMNESHILHWNLLFDQTVDELFVGEKASEVKKRAANIAMAMMYKTIE
ncbi:group III truncated hemoglobin [Flavobacterium sp. GP15]|uniref:group III truncated hemoglobin n=1 Tax=Flavobacterium sp. GP15 TaxID=2758567 RepID=UPI00165DD8D7|nr:group III truncated hemoglobin [Flavobacterium sp. GP15]